MIENNHISAWKFPQLLVKVQKLYSLELEKYSANKE